ncbi:serine integrase [Microbacterium phage Cen1621]|uniref:Serine integrase n=1 Tax=Microbacterium phage Cen1621 TaxID=2965191 RepID=A0A9E7QB35_9CAUD|nr:serine integrase [Microbacterium phage Cen1621]
MKTHASPSFKPRAVLYSRLSRESIASTSLAGQSDDLFGLADREGWEVVATFVDEGLSGGKKRANAEEALRMLADGEVDILAAYAVDRYSRQGIGEDAELVKIVRRGVATAKRSGGLAPRVIFPREGIDSAADPTHWGMRFALASELAYNERELMVSRRKGSIRRMQLSGRYTGRGPAPWGYRSAPNPTGAGRILVPDPDEAELIRSIARRLIGGESATSVSRSLTAQGVPTPRSEARKALLKGEPTDGLPTGSWSVSSLVQALMSESLLGRIPYRTNRSADDGLGRYGELVLDDEGNPLQAFEPVLDLGDYLALRERFKLGQGRGQQRQRRATRLGSGLVYCGVCGEKCYVITSQKWAYYRCSAEARGMLKHPGGLRIKAELVEDAIERIYLGAFGRLPAVEYVEADNAPGLTDGVLRLTERIQKLSAAIAAPGADVLAIAPELAALQAERDALLSQPVERSVYTRELDGTWSDVWAAASLDERRGWLARAYDHFDVFPVSAERRVVEYLKPSPDEASDYYVAAEA